MKGSNNRQWITGQLSYDTIHHWLYREFGKASKCERLECERKSTNYDWALLKGKKYERKRENFVQMCRKCHHNYDNLAKKRWTTIKKNNRSKILFIRELRSKGKSQKEIASIVGYTPSNISRILSKDTWSDI